MNSAERLLPAGRAGAAATGPADGWILMRWRATFRTTFRLLLVAILSLVLLEFGIRVFLPQQRFAVTVNIWDRDLGTRQRPGVRGFIRCPEYAIDLVINSHGLRDREFAYAKPAGTRRILCLGDSFTCGYGVQAEQTFAKVLERRLLAEEGQGASEVINAGVGSTGTAHQHAFFRREGWRYEPDVVVLCFFPGNDFWDSAISGLYTVSSDSLIKSEAPLTTGHRIQQLVRWIPCHEALFAHSHLVNLLKHRVAARHFRDLARQEADTARRQETLARRDHLTRHLLAALNHCCQRTSCRLVVMVIPAPDVASLPARTAALRDDLAGLGIPCLDLGPCLQEAAERGERLYYSRDGHWTAAGHRVVADALHDFLLRLEGIHRG